MEAYTHTDTQTHIHTDTHTPSAAPVARRFMAFHEMCVSLFVLLLMEEEGGERNDCFATPMCVCNIT